MSKKLSDQQIIDAVIKYLAKSNVLDNRPAPLTRDVMLRVAAFRLVRYGDNEYFDQMALQSASELMIASVTLGPKHEITAKARSWAREMIDVVENDKWMDCIQKRETTFNHLLIAICAECVYVDDWCDIFPDRQDAGHDIGFLDDLSEALQFFEAVS